jgi:hypothetical protein
MLMEPIIDIELHGFPNFPRPFPPFLFDTKHMAQMFLCVGCFASLDIEDNLDEKVHISIQSTFWIKESN